MKERTTIAGTALSAKLTAVSFGTLTLLASVAVTGCSGGSSTPNVISPTISGSPAPSPSGSTETSPSTGLSPTTTVPATPTETHTSTQTHTPTPTATPLQTITATQTVTSFPTAAPVTGGGGTAGPQDALLFGVGGAAMLAGTGSIVYRRRLNKKR